MATAGGRFLPLPSPPPADPSMGMLRKDRWDKCLWAQPRSPPRDRRESAQARQRRHRRLPAGALTHPQPQATQRMVTMNDEIFDRTYQAGRADLNAGIDRAVQRVGAGIGSALSKSLD